MFYLFCLQKEVRRLRGGVFSILRYLYSILIRTNDYGVRCVPVSVTKVCN